MIELYQKRSHYQPVHIPNECTHLKPVEKVENGVLVRTSEFVTDSVEDNNKQFRQDDFSLSNILATGATQLLKPTSMANHDVEGISAAMDNALNKMDDVPTE